MRRKVALKVIKLGMDTREVVARFEAERQALAMMDHPAILIMAVLPGFSHVFGHWHFNRPVEMWRKFDQITQHSSIVTLSAHHHRNGSGP